MTTKSRAVLLGALALVAVAVAALVFTLTGGGPACSPDNGCVQVTSRTSAVTSDVHLVSEQTAMCIARTGAQREGNVWFTDPATVLGCSS